MSAAPTVHPRPDRPRPGWTPLFSARWLLVALLFSGCGGFPPPPPDGGLRPGRSVFQAGDDPAWSRPAHPDQDWTPALLDRSWHAQRLTPDGWVGHRGWYRLHFELPPDAPAKAWIASAGLVGTVSELWLNGVLIGGVGSFSIPEVTAQRAVHAGALAPGLLRPGHNVLAVRVWNVSGEGGILGGPVGLFPAASFLRTWRRTELPREAVRIALAALCFGWALIPVLFRMVGDRRGEFAGAGLPAFLLGLQTLFFTQWFNSHEIREFSSLLALASWLLAVAIPPTMYGLAHRFAGPCRRWDIAVSTGVVAFLPVSLIVASSFRAFMGVYAAYLAAIGSAIVWRCIHAPPERRPLSLALALGASALAITGIFDSSLAFFPLIPQAALWWDPMDLGIIAFLLCLGGALLRRHVRARRRESELGDRLVEAHSEERRQLGRFLHDGVLQDILHWRLQAELSSVDGQPGESRPRIAELGRGLGNTAQELRRVAEDLQPLDARDVSLTQALTQLADRLASRHGVPVRLDPGPVGPLPPRVRDTFFRIAQEAVNNAGRHSGASGIIVTTGLTDGRPWLEVRDNGRGFDPAAVPTGHLGVQFLRDHAEWIGATLDLTTAPGRGTTIRITAPPDATRR